MDQRTERILEWLLREGRMLSNAGELLARLCAELATVGIEVFRANTRIPTLHPEVSVAIYIWHKDPGAKKQLGATQGWLVAQHTDPLALGEVTESLLAHGVAEGEAFLKSPIYEASRTVRLVHEVITADQDSFRFPILADLHRLGATAYLALPLRFASGLLSAASFVTDTEGGFSPEDIQLFETIAPALALCFELHSASHVRRSLLRTYLGAGPGDLVQSGRVRPGDVTRLEAAIVFSDVRGFSDLSARSESRDLVDTLNGYFGAVSEPLERHGGEILKFIGDALLVVFPVTEGRSANEACRAALSAVLEANLRLTEWNAPRVSRGLEALDHGFGLHVGTAEYGNIGSRSRLDFTVIGRDVNKASRVEGMCSKLARRIVASSEFAALVPEANWTELGVHPLKGVAGEHALFGLREPE